LIVVEPRLCQTACGLRMSSSPCLS
jgi:hypothetical protein